MSDCTVLLVDDADDIRLLIKTILGAQAGIQVVGEAGNGLEAVDFCARHQPGVVLLDISMPVMDGLQAIPRILEVAPNTRIVMLSGFTSEAIKAEALALGATGFIEKGASGAQVAAAVRVPCESSSRS